MVIIFWIIFAIIVGAIGSNRNIGFFGAFILSIILSPVIGLIITLLSTSKADEKYKQDVLITQKKQEKTLNEISNSQKSSIVEEINELKKLLDEGVITDDEFKQAKQNLIGKNNSNKTEDIHKENQKEETILERVSRIGNLNEDEMLEAKKFIEFGIKENEKFIINKLSRKFDRFSNNEWSEIESKFEEDNWIILIDNMPSP